MGSPPTSMNRGKPHGANDPAALALGAVVPGKPTPAHSQATRACLDGPCFQVERDGLQHALAKPVSGLQRGVQLAQPAVHLQAQAMQEQAAGV